MAVTDSLTYRHSVRNNLFRFFIMAVFFGAGVFGVLEGLDGNPKLLVAGMGMMIVTLPLMALIGRIVFSKSPLLLVGPDSLEVHAMFSWGANVSWNQIFGITYSPKKKHLTVIVTDKHQIASQMRFFDRWLFLINGGKIYLSTGILNSDSEAIGDAIARRAGLTHYSPPEAVS